jgi:hypothetical protein
MNLIGKYCEPSGGISESIPDTMAVGCGHLNSQGASVFCDERESCIDGLFLTWKHYGPSANQYDMVQNFTWLYTLHDPELYMALHSPFRDSNFFSDFKILFRFQKIVQFQNCSYLKKFNFKNFHFKFVQIQNCSVSNFFNLKIVPFKKLFHLKFVPFKKLFHLKIVQFQNHSNFEKLFSF